jgi:hypothetical protein
MTSDDDRGPNVYSLFDNRSAADMQACIRKLMRHADDGAFTAIAFVGYIDGRGWIADVCGHARQHPIEAIAVLPHLEAKLTRLEKQRARR